MILGSGLISSSFRLCSRFGFSNKQSSNCSITLKQLLYVALTPPPSPEKMYLQCKKRIWLSLFGTESLIHEKEKKNFAKRHFAYEAKYPPVSHESDHAWTNILKWSSSKNWIVKTNPFFTSTFFLFQLPVHCFGGGLGVLIYVVRPEQISHTLAFPALSVCVCVCMCKSNTL